MALIKSFQFCLKTMDYEFSCVNIIYILVKVFTNEKVNPPKNKLLNFHFTIFILFHCTTNSEYMLVYLKSHLTVILMLFYPDF